MDRRASYLTPRETRWRAETLPAVAKVTGIIFGSSSRPMMPAS
jgi:hypothetical protein